MNYLALNTSCGISVILRYGDKYYKYVDEDGKMASAILLPQVDKLLSEAQITLKDLDALAVCIGPGSFTGIRIAVNTARAFAYTTGLPLIGVTSLEMGAYSTNKKCTSLIYGWGRNFYKQAFDKKKQPTEEATAIDYDEIGKIKGEIVCDKNSLEYIKKAKVYNNDEAFIMAIEDKLNSGNYSGNYNDVVPFYVLPSQAERDREKQNENK